MGLDQCFSTSLHYNFLKDSLDISPNHPPYNFNTTQEVYEYVCYVLYLCFIYFQTLQEPIVSLLGRTSPH